MHRIFGYSSGASKPAAAPAPSLEDASVSLEKRIVFIEEKIRKLETEILKCKDQMAKMRPGPAQTAIKKRALQTLKQKKMYENQRDQMMNQQFTLEQTAFTTHSLKDTFVQVEALKSAKQALDSQIKSFNIDSVEDLQDDLQDLFDSTSQIQDVLSRQYDSPDGLDDADLEAELMNLEAELIEDEADDLPSYLLNASAPTHDPSASRPAVASPYATIHSPLRDQ
jgi:charged multivesicular body protein 5